MSSGSFSILPYINPPCNGVDLTQAISNIGLVDNNFTVPQTMAGIIDSGDLRVDGVSHFIGECVFDAIPKFNAGIEVSLSAVDTGTLTVTGLASFNGSLAVNGTVTLPAGTINQLEVELGYVDLWSAQDIAGTKTFGSPPIMSASSVLVNSAPADILASKSLTAEQIMDGAIIQQLVFNGYTDLLSSQVIGGIKTFDLPPSMSGASINANSINASSIVSSSITSAKILPAGIVQASIENGYVDLVTVQSIAGDKEFSGATRLISGLTVIGNTVVDQLQCGQVFAGAIDVAGNVSALTFTGALNGNATSATLASTVNILTDNSAGSYFVPFVKSNVGSDSLYIDDVTVPILTYNPSSGSLSTANLTSTATATFENVVLPTGVTALSIVSNVLTIPLGGFSLGNFSLAMNSRVTSVVFTGAIVGSRAVLVINPTTTQTFNKSTSSGTWSNLNNLSGNTSMVAGSVWICNIYVISASRISMTYANIT